MLQKQGQLLFQAKGPTMQHNLESSLMSKCSLTYVFLYLFSIDTWECEMPISTMPLRDFFLGINVLYICYATLGILQ